MDCRRSGVRAFARHHPSGHGARAPNRHTCAWARRSLAAVAASGSGAKIRGGFADLPGRRLDRRIQGSPQLLGDGHHVLPEVPPEVTAHVIRSSDLHRVIAAQVLGLLGFA